MKLDVRISAQVGVAGIAMAALPAEAFPPIWVVALSLPALVLIVLQRRTALRALDAVAIAAVVQLAAVAAAHALVGPVEQRAAIGGTLLPPLVYLTVRGEELDASRGTFLAFCVFVIGTILGDPSPLHVLGFVAAAVFALQCEVRAMGAARHASWRGPGASHLTRWRTASSVILASLAAFLACFQLLHLLPSHASAASPSRPGREPTVGPGREFELDGPAGQLVHLRDDELVRVHAMDGDAVPSDLYLRCGHFDVAELDRWRTAPEQDFRPSHDVWRLNESHPDLDERVLEIELLSPGSRLAYVPAGTTAIAPPDGLVGNRHLGSFRFEDDPPAGLRYRVACQALDHLEPDALPASGADPGLLQIAAPILRHRELFDDILDAPELRGCVTPFELASGIAAVLRARCRYELREPSGPFGHAMLDFLGGDRHGFCMHFASATAICLRLAGVPCRIGVGLYGGEPPERTREARVFGSRHAHAWVEIPYESLGWVVFDPTPPAVRTRPMWPATGVEGLPSASEQGRAGAELTPPKHGLTAFGNLGAELWPWLLAAILLGLPWLLTSRPWSRPGGTTGAHSREMHSARALLRRVLERLAAAGSPRRHGEGLEQFATRLATEGIDAGPIADAFAAYQEVRFGGHPLDDIRRRRLESAVRDQ